MQAGAGKRGWLEAARKTVQRLARRGLGGKTMPTSRCGAEQSREEHVAVGNLCTIRQDQDMLVAAAEDAEAGSDRQTRSGNYGDGGDSGGSSWLGRTRTCRDSGSSEAVVVVVAVEEAGRHGRQAGNVRRGEAGRQAGHAWQVIATLDARPSKDAAATEDY